MGWRLWPTSDTALLPYSRHSLTNASIPFCMFIMCSAEISGKFIQIDLVGGDVFGWDLWRVNRREETFFFGVICGQMCPFQLYKFIPAEANLKLDLPLWIRGAEMSTLGHSVVVTEWPEPIQRVQELAESGPKYLPANYVRPAQVTASAAAVAPVPVVDLSAFSSGDENQRRLCMQSFSYACREWGLFQVVDHGIPHELLTSAMAVSRGFFSLPKEEKQKYANDPVTYEGYGSRMGVQKGITLDWSDYYFHLLHPVSARKDYQKWPQQPHDYREVVTQYWDKVFLLCKQLLNVFSSSLGLPEETFTDCFGGEQNLGASFRMNFYPKCPEPQLALGLSPHSDPGVLAVVQQNGVSGLQVKKDGNWYSVAPVEDALVIIVGDQMEIATNGVYKSADHRTSVNGERERMSLVVFINPEGEKKIGPIDEIVKMSGGSQIFDEMTFNEYRKFIRILGVQGKEILASRASKHNDGGRRGPASLSSASIMQTS